MIGNIKQIRKKKSCLKSNCLIRNQIIRIFKKKWTDQ